MPGYIIVEVDIHDAEQYETYKKLTPASLVPFEGTFIVRGAPAQTLEGNWQPGRMVVLKFPTVEKAKQWWASEEYAPAKALRQRIATTKMLLVEGFD